MILNIPSDLLAQIHAHGEHAYPEEGAGFLLGEVHDDQNRTVSHLVTVDNDFAAEDRHHRYSISPKDIMRADDEADRLGLRVLGVFHSHPDHPNRPSEYDREHAWPWWSYVITSILKGRASASRSWRLDDDRSAFQEEHIRVPTEVDRSPISK
jgi:proteasome lid subunit RPN8/RPN11